VTKKEQCGSEGAAEELSEKDYNRKQKEEERRLLFWLQQFKANKKGAKS